MSQTINTSKIRSATKWSAITNILSKITPPVTNIILARLLTPESFGIVATINMVITFADIFADAGFQKYLIQHEFEDDEQLYKSANVAFWSNFAVSAVLWLSIFLFRNNLAELVGSKGYGVHLSVAAFTIPMLAFSSIQQAIYRRNLNFKGLFVPKLIRSIVPLIITVPLAYYCRNCWSLIIGTLAANLSDAVLLTVKSVWKPSLYYSYDKLKKMFAFSLWTLLESLSIWCAGNIDVFIISRRLSTYHLGLYKTSLTTIEQITTLITTTIIPVLFASLSRMQSDDKNYKDTFYSFQKKCSLILMPICVGTYVYNSLVTSIMLGSQWMVISTFIGWLGIVQGIRIVICYFASEVYRSKGNPKFSFIIQVTYVFMVSVAMYISTGYGFEYLCSVRVLSYIVFALMHLASLRLLYGFSITKMIGSFILSLSASVIMGAVGYIFVKLFNSVSVQMMSIFVCMAVYFVICMIIPDLRKNLFSFVKR